MWLPVLGIVPLYGEVAISPQPGSESGVFVVDGPTQKSVRLKDELDREPLRMTVEAGRVTKMTGDAVQLRRLEEFIASGNPPADRIDEVGVMVTSLAANDVYRMEKRDGSRCRDTVHIAIGNNQHRGEFIHGQKHMDCDNRKPTIKVDGLVIVKDGVFCDSLLDSNPGGVFK